MRNKRTVWEITTKPFAGAHFATFPPELAKTCILASSSEWGVCCECGAPWERVVEEETSLESGSGRSGRTPLGKWEGGAQEESGSYDIRMGPVIASKTVGWRATCSHHQPAAGMLPAIVLDPFMGSGTTALVAASAGRDWLGIELNPEYAAMAEKRLSTKRNRLL